MKAKQSDIEKWLKTNHGPRLCTGGHIQLNGYGEPPSGARLAELKELNARLESKQLLLQRRSLYLEIIRRGDLGHGYMLDFDEDDQPREFGFVQLEEETNKRQAAEKKAADIEAHVKKAVDEAVAPIVATFKNAVLISTPSHERQWWQNLRAAYTRESASTEGAKWREVAHKVVAGANMEMQKPARDWQSDYLTPRMLKTLINKLKAPGAKIAKIEDAYADMLRRYVTRKEQKTMKPAKVRA